MDLKRECERTAPLPVGRRGRTAAHLHHKACDWQKQVLMGSGKSPSAKTQGAPRALPQAAARRQLRALWTTGPHTAGTDGKMVAWGAAHVPSPQSHAARPAGSTHLLLRHLWGGLHPPSHSFMNILSVDTPGKREVLKPGQMCRPAQPWCRCGHTHAHTDTHAHMPHTDSPSPVAASAVSCGHPVSTWSAGGRPLCRYTCPRCPGRSCIPASSPRGWWATPGGAGGGGKGEK